MAPTCRSQLSCRASRADATTLTLLPRYASRARADERPRHCSSRMHGAIQMNIGSYWVPNKNKLLVLTAPTWAGLWRCIHLPLHRLQLRCRVAHPGIAPGGVQFQKCRPQCATMKELRKQPSHQACSSAGAGAEMAIVACLDRTHIHHIVLVGMAVRRNR